MSLGLVIAALLVALMAFWGAVSIWFGVREYLRVARIRGWPRASGRIVAGTIEAETDPDDSGFVLTYEVQFDFDGETQRFADREGSQFFPERSEAEAALRGALNRPVDVYRNPGDPDRSMVGPVRTAPDTFQQTVMGFVLLIGAAGLTYDYFSR